MASVLERHGVSPARALACAEVFAGAQRDGILSHGCLRFPFLITAMQAGDVSPTAEAERVGEPSGGEGVRAMALEQWDGQRFTRSITLRQFTADDALMIYGPLMLLGLLFLLATATPAFAQLREQNLQ